MPTSECRLSDRNWGVTKIPDFNRIVDKMRLPPGRVPDPAGGFRRAQKPSWETLGHTLAEGLTDLRASLLTIIMIGFTSVQL